MPRNWKKLRHRNLYLIKKYKQGVYYGN